MSAHAERTHALLSASSAHRWIACPPSARLEEQFPDLAGEAAKEGTLAHELAEATLSQEFKKGFGKKAFEKAVQDLKKHPLWSGEMIAHTEDFLDFVKGRIIGRREIPTVIIEERVDFSQWVPEGFGTADCIIIQGSTLEVIDFKYGQGVPVSSDGNPQMMLYALGAYEQYRILFPIDTIALSIVQPRIDNNSTWEMSIKDLLDWGETIKPIAEVAFKGDGEFTPGEEQCRFCRARSMCRARADENVKLAFATEKKPPLLTNDELGEYLIQGQDIAAWLKDLEGYALSESLAGREVAGWKAVEGRSNRTITDADGLVNVLLSLGYAEPMLYKPRALETITQLEKTIGKKQFAEASVGFIEKPPGKPTLVKASDKRPAIQNQLSAQDAFKEE